jgi:hypothetical protein
MVAVTVQEERKRVRLDGKQSLKDVAVKICGDVRLLALLVDLNPKLAAAGPVPAGTVVVVPTKAEAAAFAKKMGFQLGFDPSADNGTRAKRKWSKHVASSSNPDAPAAKDVDAGALARSLLERGLSPAEAGKRLARAVDERDLAALLAAKDTQVAAVARHAEAHALFPRAISRIVAVRSALDATAKPAGLRALVEALAKEPAAAAAILRAAAATPALVEALVAEAPRVAAVLVEAKELAELERGARDAGVAGKGAALPMLIAALVDGVEPLAGERLALLAIDDEIEALEKHLGALRGALKQAEDALPRQSAEVIRAFARALTPAETAKLPRPWPLLTSVVRDVAAAVDAVSPASRDRGLGGLVQRRSPTSGEGAAVRTSVADLIARATACARAADEGDAFAERLAPIVVELFHLMRPPPAVDGGTPQARLARRRAAFDAAMTAKGAVGAAGVAALVVDVLDRARSAGNAAASRMTRAQQQAAVELSSAVDAPLSLHRRSMSELGRALVVAAMALDPVVSQSLNRPTGREACALAAGRHAGNVLSAAACALRP